MTDAMSSLFYDRKGEPMTQCELYSTEREAEEGHAAMVAKLGGALQ
jgi:hypothetical protein